MSHQININRIKTVYDALGDLQGKVVFVGGATLSLYADPIAGEARPTEDVDMLVELWTYAEIAAVEEQLREKGFTHDMNSNFKYSYRINDIKVDVMPMDEESLGFSNKWYEDGYKHAIDHTIDEQHIVKIFNAPFFLAAKLEAFKNRGGGDGITSADFEDIVYILENRASIWEELSETQGELRKYLIDEIKKLQAIPHFEDWIDANTDWGSPPASYMIIEELKRFVNAS